MFVTALDLLLFALAGVAAFFAVREVVTFTRRLISRKHYPEEDQS